MARPQSGGLRATLTDRAFWLGLLAIGLGLVVLALLFNYAVMPIWTRHDAAVEVPNVLELDEGEAERTLLLAGLEGEYDEQPYNPNLPNDIVVDQSPEPGSQVKPGRRVRYYVNASPRGLVTVPGVLTFSEGKAREEIGDDSLVVDRVEMDSVRTPYANTVTRQRPEPGRQVPVGTRVTLWVSPGIDESREVTVPDVVGLSVAEARVRIEDVGLWVDSPRATSGTVTGQEPDRGERLHPGQEVRIFTDTDAEAADA
jgi:beta-lactam-binding protein with PASTA domain